MPRAGVGRRLAARLRAQRLAGPPAVSVGEVVGDLLAVQAQDPRGARLAVRARSTGLTAADVDAALEDRSHVVSWLNRGTLHLVAAADFWELHALTTPQLAAGVRRRLEQSGVSPRQAARGVDVVAAAVADEGPLLRAQLKERLAAARVPTSGQALVHVLAAASNAGHLVRGPVIGTEQAFVRAPDWVGERPADLDLEAAEARLAERYLRGHGPSTAADLARWAGVPLGRARRGLAAIADRTVPVEDPRSELVDLADRPDREIATALPPPRLLGTFEELLLGWVDRADWVGDHGGSVMVGGLFNPFALVRGRAAGTWSAAGGRLALTPFRPVGRGDLAALRRDAADVARFLGLADPTLHLAGPDGGHPAGAA